MFIGSFFAVLSLAAASTSSVDVTSSGILFTETSFLGTTSTLYPWDSSLASSELSPEFQACIDGAREACTHGVQSITFSITTGGNISCSFVCMPAPAGG